MLRQQAPKKKHSQEGAATPGSMLNVGVDLTSGNANGAAPTAPTAGTATTAPTNDYSHNCAYVAVGAATTAQRSKDPSLL